VNRGRWLPRPNDHRVVANINSGGKKKKREKEVPIGFAIAQNDHTQRGGKGENMHFLDLTLTQKRRGIVRKPGEEKRKKKRVARNSLCLVKGRKL